ncbi:MAG: glycosyltransferase family 4 protein [Nitrospirota bacterium]
MDEKIKIIRVVVGLNQGGVQQMVFNLFKGLNKDIFEPVALAIENTGAIGAEIERSGFRVINLGLHRNNFSFIKIIRRLQKVFITEKPHIVHGSSYYPSVYSRIAAKLAGVPVLISHEHSVFKTKRPKRQVISRVVSRFTDIHIAVSEGVKKQVITWYKIPEWKVNVVYNGVDTDVFRRTLSIEQAKERLDISPERFVVGYVGRLDPEKGHKYLFNAIKSLRGRYPLNCIVAGTGRGETQIKQHANDTGVSNITSFLGLRRDIPDLLSAIDVFVLPSFQEGFPNVLLEAMAVGCSVIATAIPGNNEVITDGEHGCLVPPGDSNALASAIEKIILNKQLREQMGNSARKRAEEHFSLKKHIEQMENLYKRLLREKGFLA